MTTEEILEEIRAKAAALEMSLAESKDDEETDKEDEDDSKDDAGDDEKDVKNKEDKIVDADDDNSDDEDEDEDDEKNESFSVDQIFDGEDLSEEFKNKVSTLIEAVVASRVAKERKRLEEEFELATTELVQKTLTESEELKEGLVEKIDGYLDYVVEQWMENNELALERGIRGELFESFMDGMKNLFDEHHVNVSDEQLDVIEEMRSEMEELTNRIDEVTEQNVELKQVFKEVERQSQIAEAVEGLSDLDAEKFKTLAEELVFGSRRTIRKLHERNEESLRRTSR